MTHLIDQLTHLADLQDSLLTSISILIYSKDNPVFDKNIKIINSLLMDCRILQVEVAKLLANTPIRKPSN